MWAKPRGYTYTATAGEQVQISGHPADARLTVVDPHGALVAEDDVGGPVALTLGAGDHQLELVHEGLIDASYTISIDSVVLPGPGLTLDNAGAVTLGVPVVGEVVDPSVGHALTFDVVSAMTAVFTVDFADPWILRDPVGQVRPVSDALHLGPEPVNACMIT